jgi:hypothetical protein
MVKLTPCVSQTEQSWLLTGDNSSSTRLPVTRSPPMHSPRQCTPNGVEDGANGSPAQARRWPWRRVARLGGGTPFSASARRNEVSTSSATTRRLQSGRRSERERQEVGRQHEPRAHRSSGHGVGRKTGHTTLTVDDSGCEQV